MSNTTVTIPSIHNNNCLWNFINFKPWQIRLTVQDCVCAPLPVAPPSPFRKPPDNVSYQPQVREAGWRTSKYSWKQVSRIGRLLPYSICWGYPYTMYIIYGVFMGPSPPSPPHPTHTLTFVIALCGWPLTFEYRLLHSFVLRSDPNNHFNNNNLFNNNSLYNSFRWVPSLKVWFT